jgi:hypothetical protein
LRARLTEVTASASSGARIPTLPVRALGAGSASAPSAPSAAHHPSNGSGMLVSKSSAPSAGIKRKRLWWVFELIATITASHVRRSRRAVRAMHRGTQKRDRLVSRSVCGNTVGSHSRTARDIGRPRLAPLARADVRMIAQHRVHKLNHGGLVLVAAVCASQVGDGNQQLATFKPERRRSVGHPQVERRLLCT